MSNIDRIANQLNSTEEIIILFVVVVLTGFHSKYLWDKFKKGYGLPIFRIRQFKEFYGFVPIKEATLTEKYWLGCVAIIDLIFALLAAYFLLKGIMNYG